MSFSSWRRRQGWTQVQLANKVSASQSAISHIERGEKSPSVRLLHRICDALDLTPEERSRALAAAAEPAGEAA